ncbi:hypothetical protein [Streptomyces sp. SPB074]|uniref:hypothetical protein n=1 Tax=Streptomyces sp. (strain SPB074) TaxID=465543 RepID=UPI0001D1E35A|nr:hypothetical protein [Streptomyces sp. SPB074]EFG64495.1 membrane protein [Streptomyces sp. SPB074]
MSSESAPGDRAPAHAGSTRGPDPLAAPQVLGERLKERIYASLTLLAVLVGYGQSAHPSHEGVAVAVAATALGLWLATLVADLQAHPVAHARRPGTHAVRHALYTSSPLLTSAAGPLLLTGLSALGAMDLGTALWISVGSEVAGLAAWGYAGGRRSGRGVPGAVLSAGLNAVIGVFVAGVKVLAGH